MHHFQYPFLFILMSILTIAGCRSGKLGPSDTPKAHIRFGSGGGFTGAVQTYALLESGGLYEHNSLGADTFSLMIVVPRAEARAVFEEFRSLQIDTMDYQTFGNYYHFLEWREGADSSRVTWASDDPKVPDTWPEMLRRMKQLAAPTQ